MQEITKLERNIINGVLTVEGNTILSQVKEDYFSTIQLKKIYRHIDSYYQNFGDIPERSVLVYEIFKDKTFGKDDLVNIKAFLEKEVKVETNTLNFSITEVCKKYSARKLKEAMKRAINLIDAGEVDRAQEEILKGSIITGNKLEKIRVIDFVENYEERKNELLKRKENPEMIKIFAVPTMIKDLDFQMDGGLRKGELGLILGQPEGGKSITLQDFSVSAVLEGYKVAYFTIEMTPEQTAYRFDSRLSQIKYRKFRRAEIEEADVKQWDEKMSVLKSDSLKIIGVPDNCNCKLIESELDKISNRFTPDLVVVDYAGIMTPNNADGQSSTMDWKYIGEIVRDLKQFALKLNLPLWSAAQLLVGSKEKAELTFSDIGLARQQIAAHSDWAIALIQTKQMTLMDVLRLQFIKAREGVDERYIEVQNDFDRITLQRKTQDDKA